MCGIIGVFSTKPVATEIYEGLIHLQHRGQDAAGILTYENDTKSRFYLKKGAGYVRYLFQENEIEALKGNWGLGHTRYPTVGSVFDLANAQPFSVTSPYGISMVHNGNLSNYQELKKELAEKDRYHCNSGSDLETILGVFSITLNKLEDSNSPSNNDFFENICKAVEEVYKRAKGGYSVISIIADKGMVAFRDPHGIRPLVRGVRTNPDGNKDYVFASENTMFYSQDFEIQGDVGNGEVVFINKQGQEFRRKLRNEIFTPDIFEYVYFARPDSTINDVSVYRSRLRMGENLAKKWKKLHPDILPDVIIPVPFSSNTAALSMASELGVRYTEGLYKNSFVGRTFIMAGQQKRRKSVLQKLSPQKTEIKDKVVMLLDDSIVRGTTSREVVRLVRNVGAKKVYMVSACPPVVYPDFYGINIPTRRELIAANMDHEEIREYIGTDILVYQEIEDLEEAVMRKGDHNIDRPSMPYLDGFYVTGDIDEKKMIELENAFTCE